MSAQHVMGYFGVLAALLLAGCADSAEAPPSAAAADASTVSLTPEEMKTLAETQKVCAVTGEPLGSMGDPVLVRVTDKQGKDHTVLLCCESCREELLAHADKYLAKRTEPAGIDE